MRILGSSVAVAHGQIIPGHTQHRILKKKKLNKISTMEVSHLKLVFLRILVRANISHVFPLHFSWTIFPFFCEWLVFISC